MNTLTWKNALIATAILGMASLAPVANAGDPCPSADPATYTTVVVGEETYYIYEQNSATEGVGPAAVPGSGFLTGDGTWEYKETNGQPGLQPGNGVGLFGDWFPPGCDPDWTVGSTTVPCILISEDPIGGGCEGGDSFAF